MTVQEDGGAGPPPPTRVLIADDEADVRLLLRHWLERHGGFEVVAEAGDGAAAIDAARSLRPDVAVLDLAMPRVDGLAAAREIRRLLSGTRIVIRSAFSAGRMAQKTIDAGADVYVEKGAGRAELLTVLEELFPPRARGGPGDVVDGTTEMLEAAIISMPVGAVLLDGSARVVLANPVADRLLGGALLEEGTTSHRLRWAATGQPVELAQLPLRAVCSGVPFDDVELFVVDESVAPSGEPDVGPDLAPDVGAHAGPGGLTGNYVRLGGRPVLGALDEPVGAVISVLDDTGRRAAERALGRIHDELRRSNAELANFATVASHDLSQPLQKIYGFAQLLQDDGLQDPDAPDYLARILAGCERMRLFIEDLLAFSRVGSEAHQFEPVDLDDVGVEVRELFDQDIADTGAELRVDPLPTVTGDRVQLGHLLQNLVGNALTYVATGVRPVVHVHAARAGDAWQITVDDNGIGIDPGDRERAFTMFERLVSYDEYAGTGIGLAVCAKIAEHHGGDIRIDDGPAGGTRVVVTLPDRPAG